MSYYMQQIEGTFMIPFEHTGEAYEAIMNLRDRLGYSGKGMRGGLDDIEDAFRFFGWEAFMDADGNVYGVNPVNGCAGDDDDMLFDAVAPYVVPGSYLLMCGEDGYLWAWYFDGKECHSGSVSCSINIDGKDIQLPPTIG